MEKLELVAVKKGPKWFVRSRDKWPRTFEDEDKLRFNIDRLESFSEKWLMFDELPKVAEWYVIGQHEIIGYVLKDGFDPTDKTPKELPSGSFECHGDFDDYETECDNAEIRGLYEAVYEKEPDTWVNVDLDIEVIDVDCEPLIDPKYKVIIEFPHYIDKHIVVRHKFPCYLEGKSIFGYIVKAVKEVLPEHCYVSSDYDFSFAVMMKAPVIHEETTKEDQSRMNARKPKWVEVPLRTIETKVINICTPGHNYGEIIKEMKGTDYYDLEKKVDKLIQGYLDLLKPVPVVCPHCKGYGWFEE